MQLSLLVEKKMLPIPATAIIIQDFGCETVMPEHVSGNVYLLEDTVENIQNWLRPFDGVWLHKGMGQFEVAHIKD